MRLLAFLVLLLGAALAGGGIYYASEYMEAYKNSLGAPKGPETVRVIVANKPMRYGHTLTTKDLKWVDWPKASLPAGVFTKRDELFGDGKEKRIILRAIEKDEPVLKAKVSGFGDTTRLAAQLSEGKRAYTIPINSTSGVAGFIQAGDRVDVILTKDGEAGLESGVIIQDLPVIAIDQNLDTERNRAKLGSTATVEVDARQAQKLTLAQRVGSLTLTLRGANEFDTGKVEPVRLDDLEFGDKKKPAPTVDWGQKVRVRRGTALGTQNVDDTIEQREQKKRELEEQLRQLELEEQAETGGQSN